MTNYTPVSPEYSGTLPILESSDAVSAAVTNIPFKQLMDNDAALKASVDLIMENGVKLQDVSGSSISATLQKVKLIWSDPSDVTSGGAVIAEWAGTLVVRKAGSAPTDPTDGTVVLDNTVRNAFSSSPGWKDPATLEYGTTYYYRFFPYTKLGTYTPGTALSVTPAREVLTLPTPSASLTYDGTLQTMTFSDYDPTKMDATGLTGTDAGTYSASFTPKSDYAWSDNTQTAKTVSWSIAKAAGSATLSSDSVELDPDHLSVTVTVTDATGTVSGATSSDNTIATASVSGNVVTISNVNEATGTATITISIAASTNYEALTKQVAVDATFVQVYGVEWDGTSSSAMSRTDGAAGFTDPVPALNGSGGSSPFDTLMPWAGIEIVDDADAGKLVKIPKYYYKWTRNGSTMKLQIADGPQEGFLVSPAHADRGDGSGERDYVYIGRYHCATTTYKSTSGVKPQASITRSTARSSIHNLGSKIWQMDYAMWWTVNMLYLVEFADWDSQKVIGYGCGDNSQTHNSGATDSMGYHTGTMQSSRTTYGSGTQYRYIEDWWGNVRDWCDGIYFSTADIYCIKDPSSFSDSTGGTKVGTRSTGSSGYIKAWNTPSAGGFEYALYPSDHSASEGTYVCDYCYYYSSGVVLYVGGYYYQSQSYGAFYLYGNYQASNSNGYIGCRLQKLP